MSSLPTLVPQAVSTDVLLEKYCKNGETTADEVFKRVAKGVAAAELTDDKRQYWADKFYENMSNGAVGAGRIMSGAGAGISVSLLNCYVVGVGDSLVGFAEDGRPGIYESLRQAGRTMQKGGGVGYNFSLLRPKGSFVKSVQSTASGPCSYMNIYDANCKTIESAGNRRGAQLAALNINHPDIVEFVEAKRTPGRWNNFNISVLVNDEFMRAKDAGEEIELIHKAEPSKAQIEKGAYQRSDGVWVYSKMNALTLWDLIMKSNYDYAEPGILFEDTINNDNNLRYVEYITATNPCVTGDTVVLTQSGYKPIESLVGQTTLIWNGFEWSTVVPRVTGENQEIFELKFSDGTELNCTPYHRFILSDGTRIEAKDLTEEHELASFRFPILEGDKYMPARHAYTQGFYSGDGTQNKSVIFLYNEKSELIDDLAVKSFSDHSFGDTTKICAQLEFKPKAKNFVPSVDYTIRTRLEWLAGLIDSDGTYHDRTITIWSIDRKFLQDVKYMLSTLGCFSVLELGKPGCMKMMPDGNGGEKEYNTKDCYRLRINSAYIYLLKILGLETRRVTYDLCPRSFGIEKSLKLKSKVKREKLEEKVYCFTDYLNHSGVFNGIMTANCGEQPLPSHGCCDLGPIILPKFVRNPFTEEAYFDFDSFRAAVTTQVRFLDDVLNSTEWPLSEQFNEAQNKRRIGVGFTGLANALAMMGLVYYENEGLKAAHNVAETMRDTAYSASVDLAIEKGHFPLLDADKYLEEGTCASRLPDSLKDRIRKHGIRNSHLLSIAPTGTVSLAFADNASNGIEPPFALAYIRKKRMGDGSHQYYNVLDHAFRVYLSTLEDQDYAKVLEEAVVNFQPTFEYNGVTRNTRDSLPKSLVTANEMTVDQHLSMMRVVQPFICTSISKTVNVPADYPFEDFAKIYDIAWSSKLKGVSTYRPNSILGSVLSTEKPKEEKKEESKPVPVGQSKTYQQWIDTLYSKSFPSRKDGLLQGVSVKGRFFTNQGEQKFIITINFTKVEEITPEYGLISINRPVEFLLTSNFAQSSSAWDASMRFMSLMARSGVPIPKIIENLKEITWEHGGVRYGTKLKDGNQIPLWHDSDAAAIGHAIQEALILCGYLKEDGSVNYPVENQNVEIGTGLTITADMIEISTETSKAMTENSQQVKTGKKCPECGAYTLIKTEGCERCTSCGHLGSCS